jgi:hypothetical protein
MQNRAKMMDEIPYQLQLVIETRREHIHTYSVLL